MEYMSIREQMVNITNLTKKMINEEIEIAAKMVENYHCEEERSADAIVILAEMIRARKRVERE